MKESHIQTLFSKVDVPVGVYELKIEKGKSMSYDKVANHQILGLLNARLGKLFHKISDSPWTQKFTIKKPFDCILLERYPAYIGICFYEPRKKKEVVCIDVCDYINSEKTDNRKSLTKDKAQELAEFIIKL